MTLTLAPVDGVVEGVVVTVPVRLCVEELDGLTPVLSEAVAVTLTVAVRLCVAEALTAAAVEGLEEAEAEAPAPPLLAEAVAEAPAPPLLPVMEGETLTECVEDEDSEAEAPVLNVGVVLGVIVDE